MVILVLVGVVIVVSLLLLWLGDGKTSVEAYIAPLTKIVNDLEGHVEKKTKEVSDHASAVLNLEQRKEQALNEANRAKEVAAKIKGIL